MTAPVSAAPRCTLVLIVKNEADNLRRLLPRLPLSEFDACLAIDGRSSDGTADILAAAGIRTVVQSAPGLGAAMMEARRNVDGDAMVFFHPDGNENPSDLPRMAAMLRGGAHFVVASRMTAGGRNEEDGAWLPLRKIANRAFTACANLFFARSGNRSTDAINGFRGVTCEAFDRMALTAQGPSIDYQMVIRALRLDVPIVEFPTVEGPRLSGRTHFPSLHTGLAELGRLAAEVFDAGRGLFAALVGGVAIVLAQAAFIPALSPQAFEPVSLFKWDARTYEHIARAGYVVTERPYERQDGASNTGFFSGYPITARVIRAFLPPSIEPYQVLLALSFVLAVVFWALYIRLLGLTGAPRPVRFAALACTAAFPSSFFLICPYSESMFLVMSLAYLHFAFQPRGAMAACVAGFMASATRVFGLALPVAFALARWRQRGRFEPRDALVAGAGLAGFAAFPAYCQVAFGRWDIYWVSQANGFGVHPSWDVFLSARAWWPPYGFGGVTGWKTLDATELGSSLGPVYLWLTLALSAAAFMRREKASALIFAAAGLVILPMYALAGFENMSSLVRYLFPVHAFLVLGGLAVFRPWERFPRLTGGLAACAVLFASVGGVVWTWLLRQYLHGVWVA